MNTTPDKEAMSAAVEWFPEKPQQWDAMAEIITRHYAPVRAERDGLIAILEAWQSQFGTTQISHAVARLESAENERDRLLASLPLSSNMTKNEASKLLGAVLRHYETTIRDGDASHGCVEVHAAERAIESLIMARDTAVHAEQASRDKAAWSNVVACEAKKKRDQWRAVAEKLAVCCKDGEALAEFYRLKGEK